MMTVSYFVLFSVVLKLVLSQSFCNVNEQFTDTINPCNSCDMRSWCPQYVGSGCDCFPGYFRSNLGLCVHPESCDPAYEPIETHNRPASPRCRGPFESYFSCGTACIATCDNPNPGPCTQQCVAGCFCNPGYIRNRQGTCIRREQCPTVRRKCHSPYEMYRECYTACPPTCENPNPECTKQCVYGCFCIPGYLRNRQGKCVRQDQCDTMTYTIPPQQCGPYEEFRECGTTCPPRCQNRQPGHCTLQCVRGCFCIQGYVRKGRICVRPEECEDYRHRPYIPSPVQPTVYKPPLLQPVRPPAVSYNPPPPLPPPRPPVVSYNPPPPLPPPLPPVSYNPPHPLPRPRPSPPSLPRYPVFFDSHSTTKRVVPPTPSWRTPDRLRPTAATNPPIMSPPSASVAVDDKSTNGCPNRARCNQHCIRRGFVAGFCVGPGFRKCNCVR